MKQNKKIAITGGIGSGKSMVAQFIKNMGYPVFSCDKIYSDLLMQPEIINALQKLFPKTVVNGKLNKEALSNIVFNDKLQLKKLMDYTNPIVIKKSFALMEEEQGISFCEVPLLFENNYQDHFDEVIVIIRNKEERIKSVMNRNNLTKNQVIQRINNQFNYDNGNFAKYYVIHNNNDLNELQQKTIEILQKILQKSPK